MIKTRQRRKHAVREIIRPATPDSLVRSRRAKIICTIGPACNTEVAMRDLLRLGMDVARLNFSHGTHPDHAHNIQRLRVAAEHEGRTVCILQDLQGPKSAPARWSATSPSCSSRFTVVDQSEMFRARRRASRPRFPISPGTIPGAQSCSASDGLIELRVRGERERRALRRSQRWLVR